MSELIVENLRKKYKSRTVVQDISLRLTSGEVVGLLGPNGAGKTTSFYMMVGLVPLDGGRILLDGKDLSRLPIHQRARLGLSYLPQEPSIFRKMTVEENRSEEHTSELQSQSNLVCRLLLEKKK